MVMPVRPRQPPTDLAPECNTNSHKVVRILLESLAEHSRHQYLSNLRCFARWFDALPVSAPASRHWQALDRLLRMTGVDGNEAIVDFAQHRQKDVGLKASSVARQVSVLSSFIRKAHALGLVNWTCLVKVRFRAPRPRPAPTRQQVMDLLRRALSHGNSEVAARDALLVRLLYDMALRRFEVCGLRMMDVYESQHDGCMYINVYPKGGRKAQPLAVPEVTAQAMRRWYELRREMPERIVDDALLISYTGRALKRSKLQVAGVNGILRRLSGDTIKPHDLRRAALTHALEGGIDHVTVCHLSRHKSVATLVGYYDARHAITSARATADHLSLPEP